MWVDSGYFVFGYNWDDYEEKDMEEFGRLTETKKQLELELAQMEFAYRQLEQQKSVAIVGVIANIIIVILVTSFFAYIVINSVFTMVTGPLIIIMWIAFLGIVVRSEAKDVKMLLTNGFEKKKLACFEKCRKLHLQIEELDEKLDKIQITRWNS